MLRLKPRIPSHLAALTRLWGSESVSISRVLSPVRLHRRWSFSWDARRQTPRAPYPGAQRAASSLPYSGLLQTGFSQPPCHHDAGGLLPHRFTLTRRSDCLQRSRSNRRSGLCATFRRITPPGNYPASRPVELGLSSEKCRSISPRPSDTLSAYPLYRKFARITRSSSLLQRRARAQARAAAAQRPSPGRCPR